MNAFMQMTGSVSSPGALLGVVPQTGGVLSLAGQQPALGLGLSPSAQAFSGMLASAFLTPEVKPEPNGLLWKPQLQSSQPTIGVKDSPGTPAASASVEQLLFHKQTDQIPVWSIQASVLNLENQPSRGSPLVSEWTAAESGRPLPTAVVERLQTDGMPIQLGEQIVSLVLPVSSAGMLPDHSQVDVRPQEVDSKGLPMRQVSLQVGQSEFTLPVRIDAGVVQVQLPSKELLLQALSNDQPDAEVKAKPSGQPVLALAFAPQPDGSVKVELLPREPVQTQHVTPSALLPVLGVIPPQPAQAGSPMPVDGTPSSKVTVLAPLLPGVMPDVVSDNLTDKSDGTKVKEAVVQRINAATTNAPPTAPVPQTVELPGIIPEVVSDNHTEKPDGTRTKAEVVQRINAAAIVPQAEVADVPTRSAQSYTKVKPEVSVKVEAQQYQPAATSEPVQAVQAKPFVAAEPSMSMPDKVETVKIHPSLTPSVSVIPENGQTTLPLVPPQESTSHSAVKVAIKEASPQTPNIPLVGVKESVETIKTVEIKPMQQATISKVSQKNTPPLVANSQQAVEAKPQVVEATQKVAVQPPSVGSSDAPAATMAKQPVAQSSVWRSSPHPLPPPAMVDMEVVQLRQTSPDRLEIDIRVKTEDPYAAQRPAARLAPLAKLPQLEQVVHMQVSTVKSADKPQVNPLVFGKQSLVVTPGKVNAQVESTPLPMSSEAPKQQTEPKTAEPAKVSAPLVESETTTTAVRPRLDNTASELPRMTMLPEAQSRMVARPVEVQPIAPAASQVVSAPSTVVEGQGAAATDMAEAEKARVLDQVVQNARLASSGGRHTIRVQLTPSSLGEVEIRMAQEGEKVAVQILVDKASTQQMLTRHTSELQRLLESVGLRAQQVQVIHAPTQVSASAQPGSEPSQTQRENAEQDRGQGSGKEGSRQGGRQNRSRQGYDSRQWWG
jgi:Flagellar hook-length control protein FliK